MRFFKRVAASTALALLLASVSTASTISAATAPPEIAEVIYSAAAEYGVSGDLLYRIAACESAGFRADVMYGPTTGAAGERGIMQLHPRGLLPLFYRVGFSDPFDPSESLYFGAWAISQGMRGHWSC